MNTFESGQNLLNGHRIDFLDNLRTFMIFLVILFHAGGVYEDSGIWAFFWIVDDPATNEVSGLFNIILDILMMPMLFFISGYLAPLSLRSRQAWPLIKTKAKRLLVPWAIAVLTLIPLYKIIFLSSRHLPQEHWTTYFHWSNGMWSQNWLWFLPVLFCFNALYVLMMKTKIQRLNLSLKGSLAVAFLMGYGYCVGMDLFGLQGWTLNAWLNFQNERVFIYFLAFVMGAVCFTRKVFAAKPERHTLYLFVNATVWLPVLIYIYFQRHPWLYPGSVIVSELSDRLILWFSYLLSLMCLMVITTITFRRYANRSGRFTRELNQNAYGVYILHVIVMGAMAWLLLNTTIPSLAKHLILTASTFAVCQAIVSVYRRTIHALSSHKLEVSIMKTVTTALCLVVLLGMTGCKKQEDSEHKTTRPQISSLHIAALQGNLEAIQRHIRVGSDLNLKDEYGATPLIVATTFGETDVAKALIETGADMTLTNDEGSTALHVAAFLCRDEIVKVLLDRGADKTVRNKAGHTALDTVAGPFAEVKAIYDGLGAALKPLGLRLDYEHIKRTRPVIAEMLQ